MDVNPGLKRVWIETLLNELLVELNLFLDEVGVVVPSLHLHKVGSYGCLDYGLLVQDFWVWLDMLGLEVVSQLLWNLCKDLLGKKLWIVLNLIEGYKLNDVSLYVPFEIFTVKRSGVSIKIIHLTEVGIANADDDD